MDSDDVRFRENLVQRCASGAIFLFQLRLRDHVVVQQRAVESLQQFHDGGTDIAGPDDAHRFAEDLEALHPAGALRNPFTCPDRGVHPRQVPVKGERQRNELLRYTLGVGPAGRRNRDAQLARKRHIHSVVPGRSELVEAHVCRRPEHGFRRFGAEHQKRVGVLDQVDLLLLGRF